MRRAAAIRVIAGLVILVVPVAFAACGGTSASKAGGAAGGGTTLRFHGKQAGFAPGPNFGARLHNNFEEWSFTTSLIDSTGRPAGNAETNCTTSPRKDIVNCSETLVLKGGQLVSEGVTVFGQSNTLAIVGGTGAYEGARGSLRTTGATQRGEDIVVHLLGR